MFKIFCQKSQSHPINSIDTIQVNLHNHSIGKIMMKKSKHQFRIAKNNNIAYLSGYLHLLFKNTNQEDSNLLKKKLMNLKK